MKRQILRYVIGALGLGLALLTLSPHARAADHFVGVSITNEARACRMAQVVSVRAKFFDYSWPSLGVETAPRKAFMKAIATYKDQACGVDRNHTKILASISAIGKNLQGVIASVAATQHVSPERARSIIASDAEYQMLRLKAICGSVDASRYVMTGAGALDNALLGIGCAGDSVEDVRTAGNFFTVGGTFLNHCANAAVASSTSACSGWAGSSTGEESEEPEVDEPEDGLISKEEQIRQAEEMIERGEDLEEFADGVNAISSLVGAVGFGLAATAAGPPLAAIAAGAALAGGIIYFSAKAAQWMGEKRKRDAGARLCPSMNVSGQPVYAQKRDNSLMSMDDVINDCMCQGGEKQSGALQKGIEELGLPSLTSSGFCANKEEKKRLDCLMNPLGDDDGVRRDCQQSYYQANANLTPKKLGAVCSRVQCTQFRSPVASYEPNGDIDCQCKVGINAPIDIGGTVGNVSCYQLQCSNGFAVLGPLGRCQCPDDGFGGPIGGNHPGNPGDPAPN